MRKLVGVLLGVLMIAVMCPAHAQEEMAAFGGMVRDLDQHHNSYSYQMEYSQGLGQHAAFSLGYLNEGHLPDDHRDGYLGQLWGRTEALDKRLQLSAGIGPYWHFDTHRHSAVGASTDDHGFDGILSFDAAWHTSSRWLVHLRSNWINAPGTYSSATVSLGLGYTLSSSWCAASGSQPVDCPGWMTGRELTVYGGREIVNTFAATDQSGTQCLEYRQGIARNADWTVSLLHESNPLLPRGTGVMSQVWGVRPVSGDQWRVGLGVGPYVALGGGSDIVPGESNRPRFCGVVSPTVARRLSDKWDLRFTWNRILTSDSRDTDTLMLGLGYCLADPKK